MTEAWGTKQGCQHTYESMHTTNTRKKAVQSKGQENKPVKELQVKNLKKYPRQTQHCVIDLKMELLIQIVNDFKL